MKEETREQFIERKNYEYFKRHKNDKVRDPCFHNFQIVRASGKHYGTPRWICSLCSKNIYSS